MTEDDARAWLDGEVDQTRGTTSTTYGEAYHYADEHYQTLGDPLARGDEEGHAESGLHGAMLQTLQNQTQSQASDATAKVQDSATQIATQQVSEATRISDNVDEAFAKTRVGLQSTDVTSTKTTGTSATEEFKDYMSKTPEQRLRDKILGELGITEEDIKNMPPEKQLAIEKQIGETLMLHKGLVRRLDLITLQLFVAVFDAAIAHQVLPPAEGQTLTDLVRSKGVDEIVVALSERRGGSMPMRELLATSAEIQASSVS